MPTKPSLTTIWMYIAASIYVLALIVSSVTGTDLDRNAALSVFAVLTGCSVAQKRAGAEIRNLLAIPPILGALYLLFVAFNSAK